MRALLAVCAAMVVMAAGAMAQDHETQPRPEHAVVVAMFYSGFCGQCQILDPRIEAVKSDFHGRPVTFIRFDKTMSLFGGGRERERLAARHGMAGIWDEYKGRQGFALVVDRSDERIVDVLTVRNSRDDIARAITIALRAGDV